MTIAKPGGGKSLYTAWTELLTWTGGAIVLDPKGEHAQMTGEQRAEKFGKVFYLDPWCQLPEGTGASSKRGRIARINPLAEIDPKHSNARDDLMQIIEANVIKESSENANAKHFRESAQKIALGITAHILSRWPEKYHNLPSVYDAFLTGDPEGGAIDDEAFDLLVEQMAGNSSFGRAPMEAAKFLKEAGRNERGGFITTISNAFSWVNNPAIRPTLYRSSFALRDIKQKGYTLYVVIPFEYLSSHRRYIQTMMSMTILATRDAAPHDNWTLFLLDEFPQLGSFKPIKEGLVTLRDRKVKLHMFLQNIGQLKENYDNWQTFMSSCDRQFFAVNDEDTADAVSDMMGDYVERWIEGKEGETRAMERERPLRTAAEVMDELKEGSGVQIVKPADGAAMKINLVPFFKVFKQSEYGAVMKDVKRRSPPAEGGNSSAGGSARIFTATPKSQPKAKASPKEQRKPQPQPQKQRGYVDPNEKLRALFELPPENRPSYDTAANLRALFELPEDEALSGTHKHPEIVDEFCDAHGDETAVLDLLLAFQEHDFPYDPRFDWKGFAEKAHEHMTQDERQHVAMFVERQKLEQEAG